MTKQRSFKRLVRARMDKTGESYTAARAMLLAGKPSANGTGEDRKPWLATSDANIRERTGRGWEEWFDLLDEWGGPTLTHRELARRVAAHLDIDPLAWNAQAITASYERSRGLREAGQREDGFAISVQRTLPTTVERLYDAVTDPDARSGWLPQPLHERTATRPKSARFDWPDGRSRVHATFEQAGDKSRVTIEHARLADAHEAEQMKAFWRDRLAALTQQLA